MAHRYEFSSACQRDLRQLTRRNQPLLLALVVDHIPAILRNPSGAGEKKRGDLAHIRAYALRMNNVAYRLGYTIEDDVVIFVAVGPHDAAYAAAARR